VWNSSDKLSGIVPEPDYVQDFPWNIRLYIGLVQVITWKSLGNLLKAYSAAPAAYTNCNLGCWQVEPRLVHVLTELRSVKILKLVLIEREQGNQNSSTELKLGQ